MRADLAPTGGPWVAWIDASGTLAVTRSRSGQQPRHPTKQATALRTYRALPRAPHQHYRIAIATRFERYARNYLAFLSPQPCLLGGLKVQSA